VSVDTVAVITDIHGNLPALQAALARIDELDITTVYCGGDLVGYGPHPNEVCALIAERGIPTIYGNYDYAIGRDVDDCGCAYITPADRELGQRSVEWTLANTDQASKDLMRELPFDLQFQVGATDVHLVHGSPRKVHEYGDVLFVNCGSVGKPKDGDPRGAFAILRASEAGADVTIERVEYDVEAVAREVAASGLPTEYADKLLAAG